MKLAKDQIIDVECATPSEWRWFKRTVVALELAQKLPDGRYKVLDPVKMAQCLEAARGTLR